jgi:hypothetical protein
MHKTTCMFQINISSHCTPKLKAPIISHNHHKTFWVQANPKRNSNKEMKKKQSCDHSMFYNQEWQFYFFNLYILFFELIVKNLKKRYVISSLSYFTKETTNLKLRQKPPLSFLLHSLKSSTNTW